MLCLINTNSPIYVMLGNVYDTQILNNIIINMNFIKLTVELEIYIIYKSSIFFLKEIEIT
jgi:hypothetical protein